MVSYYVETHEFNSDLSFNQVEYEFYEFEVYFYGDICNSLGGCSLLLAVI